MFRLLHATLFWAQILLLLLSHLAGSALLSLTCQRALLLEQDEVYARLESQFRQIGRRTKR